MRIPPESILRHVCRAYSVWKSDLIARSQSKTVSAARRMAIVLLREDVPYSFREIGKFLCKRNCTVILKIYRKAKSRMAVDANFRSVAQTIRDQCRHEIELDIERKRARRAALEQIRTSSPNNIAHPGVPMMAIIEAVCREFKVKKSVLLGASRRKHLIVPRHVAMFLLRKAVRRKGGLVVIGRLMKKHPTTVNYGCECVALAIASDPALAARVERIRAKCSTETVASPS
jgi:chromosomal replication initiation ATPase DnaA